MDDKEAGQKPDKPQKRRVLDSPSDEFIEKAYEELSERHKELFSLLRQPDYNQEAVDAFWKVISHTYRERELGFKLGLFTRIRLKAKGIPHVDMEELQQKRLERMRKRESP